MPLVDIHLSFHEAPEYKYIMQCPFCCKEFYHFWIKNFNDSGHPVEQCPDCGGKFLFERKWVKRCLVKRFENEFKTVYDTWR
jgi:rRNA maturation endonuclease Nob1